MPDLPAEAITAALAALDDAIWASTDVEIVKVALTAAAPIIAAAAEQERIRDAAATARTPAEIANDIYRRGGTWQQVLDAALGPRAAEIAAQATTTERKRINAEAMAEYDRNSDAATSSEPFIIAEGWREETSIRYVPESAVAEAVRAERERIVTVLLDDGWPRMQLERLGLLDGDQ
jgi:cell division septum initiation protein DivIVA